MSEITDAELARRIQVEASFLAENAAPSGRLVVEFQQWANASAARLHAPHTLRVAQNILAEWRELRRPVVRRWRWLFGGSSLAFTEKFADVELAADRLTVDTTELRKVENGSEILIGLAHNLAAAGSTTYAETVRQTAYAIRGFTDQHPAAQGHTPGDPRGASEHASRIRNRLSR